MVCHRLEQEV